MKNLAFFMSLIVTTPVFAIQRDCPEGSPCAQLEAVRASYSRALPRALSEMIGGGLIYYSRNFLPTADQLEASAQRILSNFNEKRISTAKKNWQTALVTAQTILPFIAVGAGIVIAADGLVYLITKGKTSILGSLFSRHRYSPRRALYYLSSERAFQEFLRLPTDEALEWMEQDAELSRVISFLAELNVTDLATAM